MSQECIIGLLRYCEDSELATVAMVKEQIAEREQGVTNSLEI